MLSAFFCVKNLRKSMTGFDKIPDFLSRLVKTMPKFVKALTNDGQFLSKTQKAFPLFCFHSSEKTLKPAV